MYSLHFTKAEIPPVDAFWSLTMYDDDGYLVANPINRYALGESRNTDEGRNRSEPDFS